MSGDNWTQCPKCRKYILEQYEKDKIKLQDNYGKISPEAFIEETQRLASLPNIPNNFREDYGIGLVAGKLTIVYKGACHSKGCGFTISFDLSKPYTDFL